MHPSKALLVKREIEKYLQVGFIQPIDYFELMSNIVPITKPTGKYGYVSIFIILTIPILKMIFHYLILI